MASMPPDPGGSGSAVEQLVRVYDSLHYPGAVKWAKDGRLALLTSSRVDVCEYPGEEQEPYYRWHIPLHKERHFLECGTLMAQRAYEQRDALAWMIHRITGSESAPPMFVAMDWSPTGCAWDGGCLLATLSSDGLLELWAPPLASRGTQWAPITRVTPLLEAYLLQAEYSPEGVSPELAQAAVGKDGLAGISAGKGAAAAGAADASAAADGGWGGGGNEEQGEAETARQKRPRAHRVWLDQNGGKAGAAATTEDAEAWATRQDMASITALAWAGERVNVGEGRRAALLAAGGPRLVHVWVLLPGGAVPSLLPSSASDGAATGAAAGEGPGWAEQVLNPAPKAPAFPEEGTPPARAPAAHCLAPLPDAPVALWETRTGEVARLAWRVDSTGSEGEGDGDVGCSLLLAVASTYGNIDLVRVSHTRGGGGGQWAATPLVALSGADYGVVQGLSFGTVHVAHPPATAQPADAAEQGGAEPAAPPGVAAAAVPLLVAAKGNAVHAWTIPEGRPLAAPLEAHVEPVMGVDWARAPDGSEPVLLSVGGDGLVQAWRFEAVPSPPGAGAGAEVSGLALVTEPALSAMIPSRREALHGLAVSPNGLLLAVARVAEGDEGNSRLLQFNRRLRRNHAILGVQPLFQTGWRSVVLPEEPWGLLAAMGWTHRLLPPTPEQASPRDDAVPSLLDLPFAAALDFSAFMCMQLHPDILSPQGTAMASTTTAPGGSIGNGGGDGGEAMEEDGGGDEDADADASVKAESASVASSKLGPKPKRGPGSRGGPFELRTPVDISALPEGSHDLLPYTVYHRLGALLLGMITPGAAAAEAGDDGAQPPLPPPAAPVCVWQALHALHAHAAARLLTPSPHMLEAARRLQGAARVHLMARYIDRSLARLLLLGGVEDGGANGQELSAEERRALWAMVRWLRARRAVLEHEAPAGPPVWGPDGDGTWEGLAAAGQRRLGLATDGANEAALAAELEERCFLCDSALVDTAADGDDNVDVTCQHPESPHCLLRCMETLRVVDSAECWECPLCAAAARPHLPASASATAMAAEGVGDDGGDWAFETRPTWLAPFHGGGGVWCLFCHVPCRLVNT